MSDTFVLRLRVFIPFALGYFFSMLYRVVNSVIAPDLTAELDLGPSVLGLLTAAYFIAFASFQLPLGVLLDRYGARKVEAVLLMVAAAGALMFGISDNVTGLIVGRALIGLGVSACLMAAFKVFTLWFPLEQWPRINGFQLAAGGFGAMSATAPVQAVLDVTDWRGVFLCLAAMTAAVAVAVWKVVPEKAMQSTDLKLSDQLKGLLQVFTSPLFWRVAPLATASQATFMSIQSLWAGPWMRDMANLGRSETASGLMWLAGAMAASYILLGILTAWLSRHGVKPLVTAVTGMATFMGIQIMIAFGPVEWHAPMWVLFGFFGTTGVITYAALTQLFPKDLAGRLNTALNLLVFVAAFAAQWGLGAIIDLFPVTETGHYAPEGYRTGFFVLIGLQALCLAWYWMAAFLKERC